MCDDFFPGKKEERPWLVLYYMHEKVTYQKYVDERLNKIAKEFGNYAPKGHPGKAKSHQKRIEFLADKYAFTDQLTLPKKGLDAKDAIVKVGAVCCDCGAIPKKCQGRTTGGIVENEVPVLVKDGEEILLDDVDVHKTGETVQKIFERLNYSAPIVIDPEEEARRQEELDRIIPDEEPKSEGEVKSAPEGEAKSEAKDEKKEL